MGEACVPREVNYGAVGQDDVVCHRASVQVRFSEVRQPVTTEASLPGDMGGILHSHAVSEARRGKHYRCLGDPRSSRPPRPGPLQRGDAVPPDLYVAALNAEGYKAQHTYQGPHVLGQVLMGRMNPSQSRASQCPEVGNHFQSNLHRQEEGRSAMCRVRKHLVKRFRHLYIGRSQWGGAVPPVGLVVIWSRDIHTAAAVARDYGPAATPLCWRSASMEPGTSGGAGP